VLALAAKKALTISGQDARTLTATGQVPADLCPDERVVLANLFPLGAGSLELGALKPRQWRYLSESEVANLRQGAPPERRARRSRKPAPGRGQRAESAVRRPGAAQPTGKSPRQPSRRPPARRSPPAPKKSKP
jgi:hypothetical protein